MMMMMMMMMMMKIYSIKAFKDVGAECRHDMRPFVQLPSVSGFDSKYVLFFLSSTNMRSINQFLLCRDQLKLRCEVQPEQKLPRRTALHNRTQIAALAQALIATICSTQKC